MELWFADVINCECCETKINDFDHISLVLNKYIVKFDISMRYMISVKIFKCINDLLEESSAHLLFHHPIAALRLHEMVHTNAIDVISNDTNLLWCFN